MNSKIRKILLYIPAFGLGGCALALQNSILAGGYDRKGLLIMDNPGLIGLWVMTAVYLLTVLVLLPRLGDDGDYETNFPRCALSGGMMLLGGLVMAFTGVNQLLPGNMLSAGLAIGAGAGMGLCGLCRMLGQKPVFLLDLLVAGFYAWHMLRSYRNWNADPQVQRYAFQLLAGIAAMLFTVHRGRCAAGSMDRRKLVFMGFAGIYLCLAAIAGAAEPGFYLASCLWCAGGMCDLAASRR